MREDAERYKRGMRWNNPGLRGEPFAALVILLLVVAPIGLARVAEPGGGALTGRVTLEGQGVPGVTVTAVGPATGQARTFLDGTYRITDLPAGAYTLALNQDGLQGNPPLHTAALPGPVTQGLDFEATPTAPLFPTVRLTPSATVLHPGDTFVLRLTFTPGIQEPVADLHLLLVAPGVPLRSQGPWQADLFVPPVTDLVVFSYRVTGTEPPGTYTWFTFFTRPGTPELLGPVVSASVTLAP